MSKDKNTERMEGEAQRHAERIGTLSPKTKVSLGVVCACFLFFGAGLWKFAFAVSDAAHELHDIKIAQSTFFKVSEMETWQSDFKLNMTQLGKPLGDAVPSVRVVVNQARQQNESHEN